MTSNIPQLFQETYRPDTVDDLIDLVRTAYHDSTALYPIGGGTSLDFGLPISQTGAAVYLTGLDKVIDYPAADMTVTVQAGIRMTELDRLLQQHQQQLPLDVPHAADATLGGVLATNFSGPRRFGYGTARDYVIGIRAVDGQGTAFAGGGRVVKNVAGYDFCKLLVGSLGTLGIITDVTLKLKPRSPHRCGVVAAPRDQAQLRTLLDQLGHSQTRPTAVEWMLGPDWRPLAEQQQWPESTEGVGWLGLLFEGSEGEVSWMTWQIQEEWQQVCPVPAIVLNSEATEDSLGAWTEFPAGDAALVLKANVRPSTLVDLVGRVTKDRPEVTVQAHAASGIVVFRFPTFPQEGLSQTMTSSWQPAAAAGGGNLVMLANREQQEMTRRAVWGEPSGPLDVMRRIKEAFDPHGILNPGRFVY